MLGIWIFLQEIKLEFGRYDTTTEPWQLLNGTENVPTNGVTALRKSDDYIRGYLMWTRLFTTAIIPVTLLLILNVLIIRDVITSAKKVNRYVCCLYRIYSRAGVTFANIENGT